MVKWLVENGCSNDERDIDGNTCLLLASFTGDLETVKWLLEHEVQLMRRTNMILHAFYTQHQMDN